jgi:hypothetical protein
MVANFHQHACNNKKFKSIKRFTVFKIVIHFSNIKEAFLVQQKMIYVDHHFQLHQTPKNTKNIF